MIRTSDFNNIIFVTDQEAIAHRLDKFCLNMNKDKLMQLEVQDANWQLWSSSRGILEIMPKIYDHKYIYFYDKKTTIY